MVSFASPKNTAADQVNAAADQANAAADQANAAAGLNSAADADPFIGTIFADAGLASAAASLSGTLVEFITEFQRLATLCGGDQITPSDLLAIMITIYIMHESDRRLFAGGMQGTTHGEAASLLAWLRPITAQLPAHMLEYGWIGSHYKGVAYFVGHRIGLTLPAPIIVD